jgi:hypothetical protein
MKTSIIPRALRNLALSTAALLGAAAAQADVVHHLDMTFTNGGVFGGDLVFKDDYSSLQGVNGTLVGGTRVVGPDYGTVAFNWTWYASFGDVSADEDGNANTLEDYLMQGTDIDNSDFTQVGISWFVPVSGAVPVLNLNARRPYASLDNFHRIASYEFSLGSTQNTVAEPGSLTLAGLALACVAGVSTRRRPAACVPPTAATGPAPKAC